MGGRQRTHKYFESKSKNLKTSVEEFACPDCGSSLVRFKPGGSSECRACGESFRERTIEALVETVCGADDYVAAKAGADPVITVGNVLFRSHRCTCLFSSRVLIKNGLVASDQREDGTRGVTPGVTSPRPRLRGIRPGRPNLGGPLCRSLATSIQLGEQTKYWL